MRIALLNLPFATVKRPSIALAQLRSVVTRQLGGAVRCDVFHLNHDLAREMGQESYESIASSMAATTSGLGDWFFRPAAFPELEDNAERYLRRYGRHFGDDWPSMQELIRLWRGSMVDFLDRLVERYRLDQYQVVGLTSMFQQTAACLAMARRLKERNPELVTVMGGANCETPMGEVLVRNVEALDFVFSGPSLASFPQLISHLVAGDEASCHRITGVFSRRKLSHSLAGGGKEIGAELPIEHEVPLDYDDFLASADAKLSPATELALPFETSRGCWWGERAHCTFCGLNGVTMKYRSLRPEKALALLADLFERYHPRVSTFESVDNIMPRDYLKEVFPRLDSPPEVSLFYEVKADLKKHELEVLAQARVTAIQPGIEALSTATLKRMKKGTTSFQNLTFLKHCLLYGIHPAWNLLIGFPGEEEEVYEKYTADFPLLVHLPPPTGAFPVRFDRFSPYFTRADDYGLRLRPYDFYGLIYPFPEQELADLAYYFADDNVSAPYIERAARWVGSLNEGIEAWRRRWNGEDGGLPPELTLKRQGEEGWIVDTRSGERLEHRLSGELLELLPKLERPSSTASLERHLGWSRPQVEAALAFLAERQLLFTEDGRHLSLVAERREPSGHLLERAGGAVEYEVFEL